MHNEAGDECTEPVLQFIITHKRLLNALIRANPSLLASSLRTLMVYSSYVDFHNPGRTWKGARQKFLMGGGAESAWGIPPHGGLGG